MMNTSLVNRMHVYVSYEKRYGDQESRIKPQALEEAGAYLIKSLLHLRKESLKRYTNERKRVCLVSIETKVG